jgi:putative endopeptidase
MSLESIQTIACNHIPKASCNFYLHVNKKWLDEPVNQIPDDHSTWGGFTKLDDTCLVNQINLVENLREKKDKTEEDTKILVIWEASVQRFNSWRADSATYFPITRELEILDAYLMPNKPIQNDADLAVRVAEYLHYSQINGISNVFDFNKGSDLLVANNIVLDFATCGLSLPGREYYIENNFADKHEMYKHHLANVADMINANCSTNLDVNFVQNVFTFETELAGYMMKQEQAREYDQYYTNTSLPNLYKKINAMASLKKKQENYPEEKRNFVLSDSQIDTSSVFFEKLYELFDFRRILRENRQKSFINTGVVNPPHEEHITAYDGDAIRHVLSMVLNKDNFVNYRSFLQYKLICAFKGFCTKGIDDEFFDFYGRKLNGQTNQISENKRSIKLVNTYANEMMGKVFVAHYFPEMYKKDMRDLIYEILNSMRISLKQNDWLTENTKGKALQKLDKFNVKVGYPDIWKDYSEFDIKYGDTLYDVSKKASKWTIRTEFFNKLNTVIERNEWMMSPQTVNAYFMPTQNEIVFPAAILQPPFYCKTTTDIDVDLSVERDLAEKFGVCASDVDTDFIQSVNFGGIGAVIAHEITHGYDDNGRKFDGDGNLSDWWTEEDTKLFIKKTELMAEQTNNYVFVDHEDSDKEYKMNPQLTMGENLADIGGLSLALQAMSQRLIVRGCDSKYINVNQKVLFKSFANIWKQNTKKESLIEQLTIDSHALEEFRANLVSNINEFYEVFGVGESDKMYIRPDKRVRLW